jgi:hypothetical protein
LFFFFFHSLTNLRYLPAVPQKTIQQQCKDWECPSLDEQGIGAWDGKVSLDVSKTKHGELVLLAQRDGRGQISQYNLEKKETWRKRNRNSPGSERWEGADLCRARKKNWKVKTKEGMWDVSERFVNPAGGGVYTGVP